MKITFVLFEPGSNLEQLDLSGLDDVSDLVVKVEDTETVVDEIVALCADKKPLSFVLTAYDPLRFRDDLRLNLMVKLSKIGVNPASVGFVNLNGIAVCSDSEEEFCQRLQLTTSIAHKRVESGSSLQQVDVSPVKKCLFIGETDSFLLSSLKEMGIELVSVWAKEAVDPATDIKVTAFSGVPGNYKITLTKGNGEEKELSCGLLLVNESSLSIERIKQLASAFKIPCHDGKLSLPPDRHVLSHGVFLFGQADKEEKEAIISLSEELLLSDNYSFFLDSCSIDYEKCGLCGSCIKTCMFSANSMDAASRTIHFDPELCTGCGNCVIACPVLSRDLHHYSNEYMFSIPENLKPFRGERGLRVLLLFCENNGYKAVNFMVESGGKLPASCYLLPVRCGARIGTEIIPDSFSNGFDGVALLVCARDECHNLVGSLDLERRFNLYRTIMKAQRQESGRMRIVSIKSDGLENVQSQLERFVDYLQTLQADEDVFTAL